ncbi:MAG: LLM class F420-dependent oxidoreductase [Deltaproteobacteria bacterium]
MKFGVSLPIQRPVEFERVVELAKKAEHLGYGAVWASDHVVIPDELAGRFSEVFYDPFVLLAAIASETRRIKIGTSVIILPYRNPVTVAKSVATLDVLSKGRVICGVAAGWLKEEFDALGIPFEQRGRLTDEYIEIVKTLWEEDEPQFRGEFFSFSEIKFYPKPAQKPRPPLWIGGNSDRAIRRAAVAADGWQPIWISPENLDKRIKLLKSIAEQAGRDPSQITFSVRNRLSIIEGRGNKSRSDGAPFALFGAREEIRQWIWEYEQIGVSHIAVDIISDSDEEMFDALERFADEVIGVF